MRQVTIDEAKSQLSKLIQAALQGEEVIIGRGNQPLVRLAVLPEAGKQRRHEGHHPGRPKRLGCSARGLSAVPGVKLLLDTRALLRLFSNDARRV